MAFSVPKLEQALKKHGYSASDILATCSYDDIDTIRALFKQFYPKILITKNLEAFRSTFRFYLITKSEWYFYNYSLSHEKLKKDFNCDQIMDRDNHKNLIHSFIITLNQMDKPFNLITINDICNTWDKCLNKALSHLNLNLNLNMDKQEKKAKNDYDIDDSDDSDDSNDHNRYFSGVSKSHVVQSTFKPKISMWLSSVGNEDEEQQEIGFTFYTTTVKQKIIELFMWYCVFKRFFLKSEEIKNYKQQQQQKQQKQQKQKLSVEDDDKKSNDGSSNNNVKNKTKKLEEIEMGYNIDSEYNTSDYISEIYEELGLTVNDFKGTIYEIEIDDNIDFQTMVKKIREKRNSNYCYIPRYNTMKIYTYDRSDIRSLCKRMALLFYSGRDNMKILVESMIIVLYES